MKASPRPRADATITLADGRILAYGGSDARPDPSLLGWADDVQALADQLGLDRFGVVVWHGELDHLVRPTHAHYLSAVLPNSRLMLYPQDGHLLLLQHWEDLLAAVTAGA